jgi:hypothetical protein
VEQGREEACLFFSYRKVKVEKKLEQQLSPEKGQTGRKAEKLKKKLEQQLSPRSFVIS